MIQSVVHVSAGVNYPWSLACQCTNTPGDIRKGKIFLYSLYSTFSFWPLNTQTRTGTYKRSSKLTTCREKKDTPCKPPPPLLPPLSLPLLALWPLLWRAGDKWREWNAPWPSNTRPVQGERPAESMNNYDSFRTRCSECPDRQLWRHIAFHPL